MHARYFSPSLGRFLSVDPVSDIKKAIRRPQMWNKYTCALNNPIANVDRDGRETGSVTNSAEWGLHPGGPLPLKQEAAMWAALTLVGAVSYAAVGGGAALLPFATSAALSPQGHQALQAVGEALNPNPGTLGGAADAVGSAARGGAAAVRLGQAGEAAVRAAHDIGPATKILVNGAERIPDGLNLTTNVLSEVKNVGSLSYTQQLRDYAAYASQNGLRFDLYVRPTTELSGPLLDAIESGAINRVFIP